MTAALPDACMNGVCACPSQPDGYDQHLPAAIGAADSPPCARFYCRDGVHDVECPAGQADEDTHLCSACGARVPDDDVCGCGGVD